MIDVAVPGVGDPAPSFSALGTGDRTYSLDDYSGSPLVLVFYPGDATPVCTQQLLQYNEGLDKLAQLDARVLAMSPQDIASHEKFQADHSFAFPLLYDEDRQIAEKYGVIGPLGFYRRSVFVIDANGIIRYASRSTAGLTYPSVDKIVEALSFNTNL